MLLPFVVTPLIVDIFAGFVALVVDKEVITPSVFVDNVLNGSFVVVWTLSGFGELDGDVFNKVLSVSRLSVEEPTDEIWTKEELVEVEDNEDEFDCCAADDDFMSTEVDW